LGIRIMTVGSKTGWFTDPIGSKNEDKMQDEKKTGCKDHNTPNKDAKERKRGKKRRKNRTSTKLKEREEGSNGGRGAE